MPAGRNQNRKRTQPKSQAAAEESTENVENVTPVVVDSNIPSDATSAKSPVVDAAPQPVFTEIPAVQIAAPEVVAEEQVVEEAPEHVGEPEAPAAAEEGQVAQPAEPAGAEEQESKVEPEVEIVAPKSEAPVVTSNDSPPVEEPVAVISASPAAQQQSSSPSATYIGQTLSKVPVFGAYVAPVVESRVLRPVTNLADSYVQSGVQIALPYVESAVQKAQPYVERAQPYVESAANRAQPIVNGAQVVAAVPGRVYQGTVDRVSCTVQTVKALPGHVRTGVARTTDKAYNSIVERGTPLVKSAAQLAQPYVHKTIGIITPYLASELTQKRLHDVGQSRIAQSRIVQGGLERATLYVEPVWNDPRVQAVTEPVIEWARPRAMTH